MTTTRQNRSRPMGHPTVHQPQHTASPSNNSVDIKRRYFSFIKCKENKVDMKKKLLSDLEIINHQLQCINQRQY